MRSNLKSDLEWRAIAATREVGKASAAFLDHWLPTKKRISKVTAGTLTCIYGMIKHMRRSGMRREAIRQNKKQSDGAWSALFTTSSTQKMDFSHWPSSDERR